MTTLLDQGSINKRMNLQLHTLVSGMQIIGYTSGTGDTYTVHYPRRLVQVQTRDGQVGIEMHPIGAPFIELKNDEMQVNKSALAFSVPVDEKIGSNKRFYDAYFTTTSPIMTPNSLLEKRL